MKDELTGLPRGEDLQRNVALLLNQGAGVALAVMDVDRFEDLNRELGHEAGDRVLAMLAEVLREIAPGDLYRIAGDEFAVAMPETTLEQAFLALERLRTQVQASQERFGLPEGRSVTVTIGVAQAPRDAKDVTGLLRAADAGLLAAKEGGRNQVALPPNEEMVMKTCYYSVTSVRRLKALAEKLKKKESVLLREALDDLLRKHDQQERR